MTVYIGNAVHDENGKAKGGQPGDQTGREVVTQPWYKNKKAWRVFRPKDRDVAKMIAEAMRSACANDLIGYDQSDRNTLYAVAGKVGYDPARVTTPCECDCSSLVRVCCAYAGVMLGHFNTASEPSILLKSGRFDELVGTEYADHSDRLREGDVLVTSVKGHTCVVLNDGSKADVDPEPAPDPAPEPEPEPEPDPVITTTMIRVKGSVRVREGNGKDHAQIRPTVNRTTNPSGLLPYLGQATDEPYWYMTTWQGKPGYITSMKKYTELVEARADCL